MMHRHTIRPEYRKVGFIHKLANYIIKYHITCRSLLKFLHISTHLSVTWKACIMSFKLRKGMTFAFCLF